LDENSHFKSLKAKDIISSKKKKSKVIASSSPLNTLIEMFTDKRPVHRVLVSDASLLTDKVLEERFFIITPTSSVLSQVEAINSD
jgi:hypothetical protein